MFVLYLIQLLSTLFYTQILAGQFQHERVYDGFPAERGQFPYVVGIKPNDINAMLPACTGSIIGPRHVLTEAWCMNYATLNSTVVAGCTTWDSEDCTEYAVETITLHPEYNLGSLLINDIAVVTTISDFILDNYTNSITISESHVMEDELMTVIGWSYIEKNLTWLEVSAIPEEQCLYQDVIVDTALCTVPNSKVFWSDWGGPVVRVDDGTLAGIVVQFGENYDYQLRVESYLDFINEVLSG